MVGSTLKHYRIVRKLGEGGMASVYLADDTRLDRQVALKVLPPELAADPARIERFEREAKAVAALNHPNIVTIYSVEEADGVHFLTMELVDGQSLAEMIPAEGLDPPRFFEVAKPLLKAVAAAHRKGIAHRDIKPANVMVNSEGVVKLLDLGLAKLNAASGGTIETVDETLTVEGRVIGTVPYMAPEQLTDRPLDHRIDIYSLGVVFHEMLTGRRPFRGDSTAELISAILRDPPAPLSGDPVSLPGGLGEVVERCLEKQPHYRFQSVEELSDALDAVGAGDQTPAVPQGVTTSSEAVSSEVVITDSEMTREIRRWPRPWRLAVAIGLVIATAASLIALLHPWSDPGPAPPVDGMSLVLLPLEEAGEPADPDLASALTAELRGSLGAVGHLDILAGAEDADAIDSEAPASDYSLAGTIEWVGPARSREARVSFELTRGADRAVIWSETLERTEIATPADLGAIAGTVRTRIADLLGLPAPPAPSTEEAPLEEARRPDLLEQGPLEQGPLERGPEKPEPVSPGSPPPTVIGEAESVAIPETVEPADEEDVAAALAPSEIELALYLISSLPEGVVTLYADGRQVYEREFEFEERKGGVLGRVGLKRTVAGQFADGLLVPADVTEILASVALPGEPPRQLVLTPELRGDGTDRLVIDIRKKRTIKARLE